MKRSGIVLGVLCGIGRNRAFACRGRRRNPTIPTARIKLIVPFAAGGVVDVIGRLWADKMKPLLGTVVVENQGGASGSIGASEVARCDAGWLHPVARQYQHTGTQSCHHGAAALRSGQGLRRHRYYRELRHFDRRPSVGSGEKPDGADCIHQGQSRQGPLWHRRRRHLYPSGRRDVQANGEQCPMSRTSRIEAVGL